MKSKFFIRILTLSLTYFFAVFSSAAIHPEKSKIEKRHSVDFCPLSPIFKIYTIHYNYRLTAKDELITGPYYASIH